ncbi:unnamed protein product, partial [Ceratitis capitata]
EQPNESCARFKPQAFNDCWDKTAFTSRCCIPVGRQTMACFKQIQGKQNAEGG